MMSRQRVAIAVFTATALVFLFSVGLGASRAGDDEKGSKSKAKVGTRGVHLAYKKTYEAALLEARVRNLPVFVSRHKDF